MPDNKMFECALQAQKNSYSPYSKFKVGACIRSKDGQLFSGCNYENASYGLSLCAEGAAIAAMVNAGHREIAEITIIGSSDTPCTPCGACRQRILEFASSSTPVNMYGQNGSLLSLSFKELLPHAFDAKALRK